jgi:hypothetical protein
MDIITKRAHNLATNNLRGIARHWKQALQTLQQEYEGVDDPLDKIKMITIFIEANQEAYDRHKPKCTDPVNCPDNYAHESMDYYLKQDLKRLGINGSQDAFTAEEKKAADEKVDKILAELQSLKNDLMTSQQFTYDDLMKEIEELKSLFVLGKKTWNQLFLGKSMEMIFSGMVSETVSKQLLEILKRHFSDLKWALTQ